MSILRELEKLDADDIQNIKLLGSFIEVLRSRIEEPLCEEYTQEVLERHGEKDFDWMFSEEILEERINDKLGELLISFAEKIAERINLGE